MTTTKQIPCTFSVGRMVSNSQQDYFVVDIWVDNPRKRLRVSLSGQQFAEAITNKVVYASLDLLTFEKKEPDDE